MYNKVECIRISCDNCGEVYSDDHSGFSIFLDEGTANEYADNDSWHSDNGKHYCPDCHTINDDDEIVIDESKKKIQ